MSAGRLRFFAVATLSVLLIAPQLDVRPAASLAGFRFTRFAGTTRYDTASKIASDLGASPTVLVARGDVFADAMAGTYLAGASNSSILLTRSDQLPPETDTALRNVGATKAILLGGTDAISTPVETALRARGLIVERIAGRDRYDTAQLIAQAADPAAVGRLDTLRTAVVVSGANFPDAVAGGPLSFSKRFPTILTTPAALSSQASAALANLSIAQVLLLGGNAAVSSGVEAALRQRGIQVTRVGGIDRVGTAIEVAKLAITRLNFSNQIFYVARGDDFADALAISAHAGRSRAQAAVEAAQTTKPAPVLLTATSNLASDALVGYFRTNNATLRSGFIAGGSEAVSPAIEQQLADAAANGFATVTLAFPSAESGGTLAGEVKGDAIGFIDVSGCGITSQRLRELAGTFTIRIPASTAPGPCFLTFVTTFTNGQPQETDATQITITQQGGGGSQIFPVTGPSQTNQPFNTDRTCTVSGPPNSVVDLRLFPTTSVATTSGVVTFLDQSPADAQADETSVTARMTAVTGAVVASGGVEEVNDVASSSGSLTVTIRSTNTDDVTLVVWADQPDLTANFLDLNATPPSQTAPTRKTAREPFGFGCRTVFVPSEGGSTTFGPSQVTTIDRDQNFFIAGGVSYFYDSNDSFQLDGNSLGTGDSALNAFEARLTVGDFVSGTYTPDRASTSIMNLRDDAPSTPGSVTIVSTTDTTVTFRIADSSTATNDQYRVYRTAAQSGACPDFNTALGRQSFPASANVVVNDSTPNAVGGTTDASDTNIPSPPALQCYAIAAVDDGDESPRGATTRVTPGQPLLIDARADDSGNGLLDAADLLQLIFSEPMNATSDDAGSRLTLGDSDGTTADLTCGTSTGNVRCTLQPAGTYNGTSFPANQVLRITPAVDIVPTAAGTVAGLAFPATVTALTAQFADAAGNAVSLANSPTRTITVGGVTPARDAVAPTITGREETGTDQITVTFTEAVTAACGSFSGAFWTFDSGTGAVNPTALSASGANLVLTFPSTSPILDNGASQGTLAYTQNAPFECGDVIDLSNNQAPNSAATATTDP